MTPSRYPNNSTKMNKTPELGAPAGVPLDRLVRLSYDGVAWTAEKLPTSICHVIFRNTANPSDGMTWSAPTKEMSELAWKIYHTNYEPTREELYGMLSVIESFRTLLHKPAKRQRAIAKALREVLANTKISNAGTKKE